MFINQIDVEIFAFFYLLDGLTCSLVKFPRNSLSPVDKKPKFEIDLRVEGVPQDAILKTKNR